MSIEGFNHIYDRNVAKTKYLLIGDKDVDTQAARNAGIDVYLEDYFKK